MTWSINLNGHDNETDPEEKKKFEAALLKEGHKLAKKLGATSATGTTNTFGSSDLLNPDASWAESEGWKWEDQ